MSSAILLIASELPTHSAITIFPYDHLTETVMLEGHNIRVDDIRVRQQVTPEFLKADPEAGADIINNLVDHIEKLEQQVKSQQE